jgi:hypothetical protein
METLNTSFKLALEMLEGFLSSFQPVHADFEISFKT